MSGSTRPRSLHHWGSSHPHGTPSRKSSRCEVGTSVQVHPRDHSEVPTPTSTCPEGPRDSTHLPRPLPKGSGRVVEGHPLYATDSDPRRLSVGSKMVSGPLRVPRPDHPSLALSEWTEDWFFGGGSSDPSRGVPRETPTQEQ